MGNKLAELLVPNMDEKVDPTMMAALMSACSLINAGAGTEEVSNKFSTITKFQPIAWESYFCW